MIAYVEGPLTYKSPAKVIIDIGGIGYELHISLNTWDEIEKLESVKLLTYMHVKEDAQTLYGFYGQEEKDLFGLLISVNGVGTNTARLLLSAMQPAEVSRAISTEDVAAFKRVKGIGPKTAKRIIIDLKDKVEKTDFSAATSTVKKGNTQYDEALSALIALGFSRQQAMKAVQKTLEKGPSPGSAEKLIKEALKMLT